LSAKSGEPPVLVARKLFTLTELCEVNGLHVGNAQAEAIVKGLTHETLVAQTVTDLLTIIKDDAGQAVEFDPAYIEAICDVYIRLMYAYVKALEVTEAAVEATEEVATPETEEVEEKAEEDDAEEHEGEETPESEPEEPPVEASPVPEPEPAPVPAPAPATPPAPESVPEPAPPAPKLRMRITRKPKPPLEEPPPTEGA
jgi:hypothetical protein